MSDKPSSIAPQIHDRPDLPAKKSRILTSSALEGASTIAQERDVGKLLNEARGLIRDMIENDPNDPISDAGHVVLDLWREHASNWLAATTSPKAISEGSTKPEAVNNSTAAAGRSREDEELRATIDAAVKKYWTDSYAQSAAFDKWKAGGFEGNCPQHSQGSIPDYVYRHVSDLIRSRETSGAQPVKCDVGIDQKTEVSALRKEGEDRYLLAVLDDAQFLIDRLAELNIDDCPEDFYRDYAGHVTPAISRLRNRVNHETSRLRVAHPSPAVPEGWKLVPDDDHVTHMMTEAGIAIAPDYPEFRVVDGRREPTGRRVSLSSDDCVSIYGAMLSASPPYKG